MAWSVTPRNTATKAVTQGSGTSLTVTLTVTATVAGDLCLVAIGFEPSTTSLALTWTPPAGAGFVEVERSTGTATSQGLSLWASNTVPPGTTSLAFALAVPASNSVFGLTAVYGCWGGGSAATVLSEAAVAATPVSSATVPSVTTGTETFYADLGIWAGLGASGATPIPSNPTGTGTWTSAASVAGAAAGRPGVRMSAQIGGAAQSTQTASGSTVTSGLGATAVIAGFPPSTGAFLSLFPNNRR